MDFFKCLTELCSPKHVILNSFQDWGFQGYPPDYFVMWIFLLFYLTPFSADRVEIVQEAGTRVIYLIGNVVIEDEATRITAIKAIFNEGKSLVDLKGDVKIVDKNGVITARYGRYWLDKKIGKLSGDVILTSSDKTISADSLRYDGIANLVEMTDSVKIVDHKNKLVAMGSRGWYDLKREEGVLTKQPNVEISREGREPIRLKAREFQLLTNENKFYGYDSVVAVIDSITIYADTLMYNLDFEHGELVKPSIYEKKNILKGSRGDFKLKDKVIQSFMVEDGWSKYYTNEGSENIIEGEKISITFNENKASKITVQGNPRGVLTMKKAADVED